MYNSQQADMHLMVYFVYKSQKYKVLLFLHERLTLQYLSSREEHSWFFLLIVHIGPAPQFREAR